MDVDQLADENRDTFMPTDGDEFVRKWTLTRPMNTLSLVVNLTHFWLWWVAQSLLVRCLGNARNFKRLNPEKLDGEAR